MKSNEYYQKYAAIIYGSIFRLTRDKSIADKIFSDSFIDLYHNSVHSEKAALAIPSLLRSVYSVTLSKLKESGMQPVEANAKNESDLLDLLCSKSSNLQEAATILGMSEKEARKKLRFDLLKFREKQAAG